MNFVSCKVMQLGKSRTFIICDRLSFLDFRPAVLLPIIENLNLFLFFINLFFFDLLPPLFDFFNTGSELFLSVHSFLVVAILAGVDFEWETASEVELKTDFELVGTDFELGIEPEMETLLAFVAEVEDGLKKQSSD